MFGDPKYHFQRVEGAVIGFAVADALGVPVEFSNREERRLDPVYEMRSGGTHRLSVEIGISFIASSTN